LMFTRDAVWRGSRSRFDQQGTEIREQRTENREQKNHRLSLSEKEANNGRPCLSGDRQWNTDLEVEKNGARAEGKY